MMKRILTVVLALCLLIGAAAPAAYATDIGAEEIPETETTVPVETEEVPETTEAEATESVESEEAPETTEVEAAEPEETEEAPEEEPETSEEPEGPKVKVPELPAQAEEVQVKDTAMQAEIQQAEELSVKDYASFLANLKVLEGYADAYAATSGKSAGELIVNYIRTGVERYNDDNWTTLAGAEITGFTSYVAQQDAANGTTAQALRDIVIADFKLPNGNQVDFGHMFGTMNIACIAAQASADLGGWAGDICDLLYYSKNHGNVPAGTVDEQAAFILENCFGIDAKDAMGMDDFYGDMDAIYLMDQMKAGKTLSKVMEDYFTEDLSDVDRSEYFLKNRFKNLYTKESVREAVYNAYANNVGLQVLEAKRGLSGETDLRMACCYAFADYVYAQAGHTLEEPTEPDPEEPTEPDPEEPTEPGENPYYSVFSSSTSNLAPGITQTIKYAYSADNKQMAFYLAEVDVTREDVTIKAGYRDADPGKGWGMQRVVDQANAMNKKHTNPDDPDNYVENFRAIVATNGAGFNMGTGQPSGLLVMDGKTWSKVNNDGFFAILKDGSAKIGTTAEYEIYKDQIQEAISGFGSVLVKDGEIVAKNDGGRASRTAIGIKANGAVVMMVLDGRQEPFSCGGTMAEIAQIMKDAGCVEAINLDGGGSTTFAAKPEGSDEIVVVNRPSDGYQRSVSTSLIAVSTAKTSNEFSHVNITSEYDYLTIGTSLDMKAVGVSESGGSAAIPEDAAWAVSDEAIGTITAEGVFTAAANGDAEVQMVLNGEVLGKKTLHVVVPDALTAEKDTMNVVYNQWEKMPLLATYQGNPVAFSAHDVYVMLQYSNAGGVDGLNFYIEEAAGYRTVLAGAVLITDFNVTAMLTVNCYRADEAVFDFENATAGDTKMAWKREVTNAEQLTDNLFQIVDASNPMELSYQFAMDMTSIEIPEQLADITYMLPGADTGKSAWDFLLMLADRVGELTEVRITVQLDPDLDVDISNMRISNDLFTLRDAKLDENNLLTIVAGWNDQTEAVDPVTVNSLCILSGLKATPKNDAWDANSQIMVQNTGTVSYKIFLRASSLYSFACVPENQEKYALLPYSGDQEEFYLNGQPLLYSGGYEKGAYYSNTYATFEDKITLSNANRNGWYTYDDQLFYFVDNKALTGIQLLPGYEDAANKYFYEFDEGGVCTRTVTGLIELDGDVYYAIAGEPRTGWVSVPGAEVKDYYFHPTTFKAVDGTQKIGGYTYTFTDRVLTRGQLVTDSNGTRYMWAGQWAKEEWLTIDGREAYAQRGGYFLEGLWKRYYKDGSLKYFAFGEDGFWMKDYSGLYDYNGKTYLIQDGIVQQYAGLVEIDGDYYYFCSTDAMVKNSNYWISKPNGIVPNGRYQIDADGKVDLSAYLNPPTEPTDPSESTAPSESAPTTPTEPEPLLNGIVKESEETWYYYVDGVKTYAGLIVIDGDFYYVNSFCKVVHDTTYWISKNNGYMTNGSYTFDKDGKLVLDENGKPVTPTTPTTPTEPSEKLNGIVKETEETWYYYVDGVKTYAGLIKIDGDFYYVTSKCQVIHGQKYWISKNNGYVSNAMYVFDEDGKMVMDGVTPVEPKPDVPTDPAGKPLNGIVKESEDVWYYYVDGVKTYAGLIKIGEDYYYVDSKCMVKHDCTYWISKNNGITKNGSYAFDKDGKMVLKGTTLDPLPPEPELPEEKPNGIIKDGDNWYYYVDGVKTYAGLIIIDGYYYYVDSKCMVKHDCEYWISKNNGYMKNGRYTFDAEGRMIGIYPTV